jgi:hypothetical protein
MSEPLTHKHFEGRWIGETMECDSPAHLWHIRLRGTWAQVETVWEGHETIGPAMRVTPVPDQPAFEIKTEQRVFIALLLDPQHFIIEGWDTNDMRNNQGPAYDVIFSRPGIAELTAQNVWLKWRSSQTLVE